MNISRVEKGWTLAFVSLTMCCFVVLDNVPPRIMQQYRRLNFRSARALQELG